MPCQVVAKNQSDSALDKFIIIMFDDTIYSLLTENSVNQIVFFTDSLNVWMYENVIMTVDVSKLF